MGVSRFFTLTRTLRETFQPRFGQITSNLVRDWARTGQRDSAYLVNRKSEEKKLDNFLSGHELVSRLAQRAPKLAQIMFML